MSAWTIADAVIPDLLPGLIDHGPATVTALYKNTGNVVLDTQTTVEFATVGINALLPGDADPGHVAYRFTDQPKYALPGQSISESTTSVVPVDNGASVDSLPLFGVVRVTATTVGAIGSLEATPVTQSTVIVIFPWKELLALILLLVVLRILVAGVRRGWRRLRGRGNNTQQGDVQDVASDSAVSRLSDF